MFMKLPKLTSALVASALLFAMGCSSQTENKVSVAGSSPTVIPVVQGIGQPLPELTVEGPNNEKLSLKSPEKHLTLVALWAPSWYANSRTQLAELNKLQQQWSGKGLRILGVGYDTKAETLRAAISSDAISFEMGLGNEALYEALKVQALPTYWFIDANGSLITTLEGFQSVESLNQAITQICDKNLATPSAP